MSRRQREGFLIFHDTLELLAEMKANDVKDVLLAVGALSKSVSHGEKPEEITFKDGIAQYAYNRLKDGVEYSNRKYQRSAAFNRAKRLGITEPQKKSIKDLASHGFSASDIAVFKDADEEEIQEVLNRTNTSDDRTAIDRTATENKKIMNFVDEIIKKGVLCERSELEKQVSVWIDQGEESQVTKAMGFIRPGMQLSDLMSYVNNANRM